jgi:hypothetical protein
VSETPKPKKRGRPVNRKCQDCALNRTDEQAKERDCYAKKCQKTRWRYQNRPEVLASTNARYVRKRVSEIKRLGLPLRGYREPCAAQVLWYRDRVDGSVHAVMVNVYDKGKLIGGSEPLHCEGIDGAQLMQNVVEWIELLKLDYGEDMSVRELRVPISGCPICGGPENEY